MSLIDSIGQGIEKLTVFTGPRYGPAGAHDLDSMEAGGAQQVAVDVTDRERVLREHLVRGYDAYAPVRPRPYRMHASPLRAFANAALHKDRTRETWPVPVVYQAENADCVVAVEIEHDTFLVHAKLDIFYREVLCTIVDQRATAESMAHTMSMREQDDEEECAAALEMGAMKRACRATGKYVASDWVIYTHNTSALMNDVRTATAHSAHLDYYEDTEGSASVLNIRRVPFPVVCFFCGNLPNFARPPEAAPTDSTDDAATILELDGIFLETLDLDNDTASSPGESTARRREASSAEKGRDPSVQKARQGTFEGPLSYDDQWVVVPVWFLTLRSRAYTNGATHAAPASVPSISASTPAPATTSWLRISSVTMDLMQQVENLVASKHAMAPTDPNYANVCAVRAYAEGLLQVLNSYAPAQH